MINRLKNLRKLRKMISHLGTQIFIAMILGVVVGLVMGPKATVFAPLGDIFIKLIKMLVIPLVAFSIISGAAALGGTKSAGKLGLATFGYYVGTTAFAVAFGLILGAVFEPGIGLDINAIKSLFSTEFANRGATAGGWEIIKGIIPDNPIKAMVDGNILQILFFCLFFGFGVSILPNEKKNFLMNIFNYITDALIWMIEIVMLTAPIGVFGLMANSIGTFGYEILGLVFKLFVIYAITLIIHTWGFYPLTIKLFSKMPLRKFFAKISKAQMVAFSTSSSMATLPISFEVSEEELGVSKETSSFVLPLGATINMNGNAIYYALVAMFFSQMFGIPLGLPQYLAIIFTATIGSIGQAGVPGPTLLVVAVLVAADLPVVGIPLLFGVDRLFDMMRTVVNITGDISCAIIVDGLKE
ncbi:dicarboxylate/amino acid:cation symporter [Candidatus Margulisiibacteriota bacterium]